VAAGSHGLPTGIVPGGANRHDIRSLEDTLKPIVTAHPLGMNLCLDAGYTGAQGLAEGMGYKAHIRGRGKEREEKERDPQYVARRRVAEVCRSWMNRFRKLPIRYEKKARNYQGLAEFACAGIVWRNLIPVHPGLIPG
jgi:transposase